MRTSLQDLTRGIVQAAVSATRCREAARSSADAETRDALLRAANRYSGRVSDLASELARNGQ